MGSNVFKALPRSFYLPSASEVAPRLLGHWLLRRSGDQFRGGPIVETEAYLCDDPACHAAKGKTERNRVMFGPPGHAYVYFIYGCHYCVNAVCMPEQQAEAVLIRAIEPVFGVELMRKARGGKADREIGSGPAKLCEALEIARPHNGLDLCDSSSLVFIAENPLLAEFRRAHGPVQTSPRIGITRAASLPLRFYLSANTHVSGSRSRKTPTPRLQP